MIRTVIIDDEPSAVDVISLLLHKKCPTEVQVVGTSNSPFDGKQMIEDLRPDLVFLDIEMPGLSGIELAAQVLHSGVKIIFITAYDAYAINAFRVNAIDYLLKPVDGADLVQAVYKVKSDMERKNSIDSLQLQNLQQLLKPRGNVIGIGMAEKIQFINTSEIIYCQANGGYTILHIRDGAKIVSSKTLGDFEDQLSSSGFLRIHHSYLINLSFVREFQRNDGGYVVMNNNVRLEVSQRKRKDFLEALNHLIV